MKHWFKRKQRQIQRVIDFLPIIWRGFDFDYRYSIDVFRKQLERQAKFLESDSAVTSQAKNSASRIRTAISLMDKVYDQDYATEYLDTVEELYGKTLYEFVELEDKDKKGDPYYTLKITNENAVDEKHQKKIDDFKTVMMTSSYEKQERAHKLLWDFVSHNIRNWWD